ncbi:DUF6335 family protein [Chlorogloea sp. CCALA 695]|uniref:DUF6335 family protein n=2 Tax=Chlorogloea sp. CCALA 695 TaxID=2107693 RepID=UPI0030DCD312
MNKCDRTPVKVMAKNKNTDNSDLPQEVTESYGTGVHESSIADIGDATLTGGDIDANLLEADAVGDEAVGGTVSTPDQDVVDEIGKAVGLEMSDSAFLRTTEILEERDTHRWEDDPMSSEDYEEHKI